jgi:hypothetical protein
MPSEKVHSIGKASFMSEFTQKSSLLKEKDIRKEIGIVRIIRMFAQFVRNQYTCQREKNRIHLTITIVLLVTAVNSNF